MEDLVAISTSCGVDRAPTIVAWTKVIHSRCLLVGEDVYVENLLVVVEGDGGREREEVCIAIIFLLGASNMAQGKGSRITKLRQGHILGLNDGKAQQRVEGDVEKREFSLDVVGVSNDFNLSSFKTLPDTESKEVDHAALQVGAVDCHTIACFDDVDQEYRVVIMRADLLCATIHVCIDRLEGGK